MTQQSENKWDKLDWLKGSEQAPAAPAPPSPTKATTIVYKPPLGTFILGIILCPLAGWFMMHLAQTNDRGLNIEGIIHLGVVGAARFYWAMSGICFAATAMFVFFGIPQLFIRRQIVLEDDVMTLPGWGFSSKHYCVPVREIEWVKTSKYDKYRFLKIRHAGKSHAVNSTWLPHDGDFDTILQWLQARGITFSKGA